ncbi:MAG: hypothetical protein ACTSRP_20025 [Candidatus Helarchaeota archaeon]
MEKDHIHNNEDIINHLQKFQDDSGITLYIENNEKDIVNKIIKMLKIDKFISINNSRYILTAEGKELCSMIRFHPDMDKLLEDILNHNKTF